MPAPLRIQAPRTLRGGLASVAVDLNDEMPVSEWRTGVQFTSQCDAQGFTWGCSSAAREAGAAVKAATTLGDAHEFYPATIGARTECMVAGGKTVVGDIVRQVAEGALERVRYGQLATILSDGDVGRDDGAGDPIRNPSFVYDGTAADGYDNAAPTGLVETLRMLLESACSCYDQQLVLHVPRAYLPYLLTARLVKYDAAGGVYRMGDHLVSFDCYANVGPDLDYDGATGVGAGQNAAAADGSEVWIYATGRPLIGLDSVDVSSTIDDPRMNLYGVVAEQGALPIVDPCCIVAAKADVSP